MGQYDYSRLVAGKQPLFARIQLHLADGGSVQYLGLGYTVTELHEMRWGIEMQPDPHTLGKYGPFRVGPELDYWTPVYEPRADQIYHRDQQMIMTMSPNTALEPTPTAP